MKELRYLVLEDFCHSILLVLSLKAVFEKLSLKENSQLFGMMKWPCFVNLHPFSMMNTVYFYY